MARIPVSINPRSDRKRQVTAIFYVDGQQYESVTTEVEEFAIPTVVAAAYAQIEDPDLDMAIEHANQSGDPLPPGY